MEGPTRPGPSEIGNRPLTPSRRAPVLTVTTASKLTGRSFPQTNEAISRRLEVGVLSQVRVGRRNRAFEALDIIDALTNLEPQLASPEEDTLWSQPSRRVFCARATIKEGSRWLKVKP